ncbi:MAG TPA: hypothetical protein VI485_19620 [Vicinamibacterales bacterium]|nr:hypothetical protein [Vicinamibacterales bacterium]
MTVRDVPRSGWCSFLERFSRAHRGWLATIHGIERGVAVTRVPSEAIKAIALEQHVPDAIVRLTFLNGVSLCAPRPSAVRVQETKDGAECALEVDTAEGAFIRLAFRATALPEQLDGIAPAEMAAEASTTHQNV